MKHIAAHSALHTHSSLPYMLPPGIFASDDDTTAGDQARTAFAALQSVIDRTSLRNAALLRFALLQALPRMIETDASEQLGLPADFLRRYFHSIAPQWYTEVIDRLSEAESEVLLKLYVTAHEFWGMLSGIGIIARALLEACVNAEVPVRVETLTGEVRAIPPEQQSKLGQRFAALGVDFTAGRSFLCRPRRYRIIVGPVSWAKLRLFQAHGWACDLREGDKLRNVLALAEPYYLQAEVHFLVTMIGFVAGRARLGRDKLGQVYS